MTSGKNRDEAERYDRNQEEHHRRSTFQDEYRTLLGVDNYQPPRSTGWRLSAGVDFRTDAERSPAKRISQAVQETGSICV